MTSDAGYWDEHAESFDDAPDHGLRDPQVRRAWAELLTPLLPPAPSRIADVGCGTGSLAVLMASAGHVVLGLDLSAAMVQRASAKARAAHVEADFVVGDAACPPWPEASFDVVLCRHVLWALTDPAAAIDQWFRILRPGGRLLLIEGRWWTGAGMTASEVTELLGRGGHSAAMRTLPDPALWGQEISDERFLVLSQAAASHAPDSPAAPRPG
jgi:SAM-dependent methyltransferase